MAGRDIWRYCTAEQMEEVLRSFHLLQGTKVRGDRYMACLYAVSNHIEKHYHIAVIPKKNGGRRKLSVPDILLRTIQRNIVKYVLPERSVSQYATAYRPNASVLMNACPHVGTEQVLKLDIRDFFHSITFQMVYQSAFPAVYYPPAIRMLLTSLCCFMDCLPQGAPSSPAISNLVMKPFDEYMGSWCKERRIQYTRYCDDMTFSGNFVVKKLKLKVKNYLYKMGFELNEQKTKVQRQYQRQIVTGIVVNEKPQVCREYRRQLRAEIYYCRKYGVGSHLQRMGISGGGSESPQDPERYAQHLLGKINYVLSVDPGDKYFLEKRDEILLLAQEFRGDSIISK